jgi:hypothetical protein
VLKLALLVVLNLVLAWHLAALIACIVWLALVFQ